MPKTSSASAPGKIILTGEYAVLFGKRAVAVPSRETITAVWTDDASLPEPVIIWEGAGNAWIDYAQQILALLKPHTGTINGRLAIASTLPLGKGMGSSTALVIAISRCLLGDSCEKVALAVEDEINPGHSGIDFAVIWRNEPILFARGQKSRSIVLPKDLLTHATLIDTGTPNESTRELVTWMKARYATEQQTRVAAVAKAMAAEEYPLLFIKKEEHSKQGAGLRPAVEEAIETIGTCTERLLKGESLHSVMRDHHRAQIALGVVPDAAQKIIADIEASGGAAKIIGAGGRTGGGGMVLAIA